MFNSKYTIVKVSTVCYVEEVIHVLPSGSYLEVDSDDNYTTLFILNDTINEWLEETPYNVEVINNVN